MDDDTPQPVTDGTETPPADTSSPSPQPSVTGELPPASPTGPLNKMTIGNFHPSKRQWVLFVIMLLLAGVAASFWWRQDHTSQPPTQSTTKTSSQTTATSATKAAGLQLDTTKNYGDKYASGVLPVGDGKYTASAPKQGYVYACSGYASNLKTDTGGASTRGPWFTNNNTQYDINKKAHVAGSVSWQGNFSNDVRQGVRVIVTNDLPNHTTGVFPIASSDPAYSYDRNPNSIKAQSLDYSLPASPTYGSPTCMGGQSGVMLTGVALFNGFDAGGRDAGAWEVQDSCSGHPEKQGEYHYHTLSSCIKDTSVRTVIGFALDGFPITGPKLGDKNILTTADLDECHGLTSQVMLDGKQVTTYHYVMTQDFPYSVSCFRSTAVQPPGQQAPATRQHP